MNQVPSAGGTRGVFEIFVPGAFLFLNIVGAAYVWPTEGDEIQQIILTVTSQAVPSLAVLICFGYLLGVLLRLLKTTAPDRWSGYFGWLMNRLRRKDGRPFLEEFPYFKHIEKLTRHRLPDDAQRFYLEFWGKTSIGGNREFFNYCKTIINAIDARSATEIYAAEALTRYVASMFYALLASFILTVSASVAASSGVYLVLACAYLLAMAIILRHLRFLRVKEVETVFAATMRNYYSGDWPKITERSGPTTESTGT